MQDLTPKAMNPFWSIKKNLSCWLIPACLAVVAFSVLYFRDRSPAKIVESANLIQNSRGELYYLPLGLSYFRAGRYLLRFNAPVKRLVFYSKEGEPVALQIVPLNSNTHQFQLKKSLYISRIKLILMGGIQKKENLFLQILVLPSIPVATYFLIFILISALSVLTVFTFSSLVGFVRRGFSAIVARFRVALGAHLFLLSISLLAGTIQAVGQYRLYGERLQKRPELAFIVFTVMVVLLVGWKVSQKRHHAGLFLLFAIFVLLYLAPIFPFSTSMAGDALYWAKFFSSSQARVSLSEPLSSLIIYSVMRCIKSVTHTTDSMLAMMIVAKMMGLAYLIITLRLTIAWFLSRKTQALFFLLCASLPVAIFFIGYPEMAFYSFPLIMLFFYFATKYHKSERGKDLILAVLALLGAVWMHGSALALLPALCFLPFCKARRHQYLRTLLKSVASAIPFLLWLVAASHLQNHPIKGIFSATSKGGAGWTPVCVMANPTLSPFS